MNTLIGLILLPAIAAFMLIALTPVWQLQFKKLSSERLLFWIFISGTALNIYSAALFLLLEAISFSQLGTAFLSIPDSLASAPRQLLYEVFSHSLPDVKLNDTAVLSFFISTGTISFFKIWAKINPNSFKSFKDACKTRALDSCGDNDSLEELFRHSVRYFIPVMINLKSRKVYIGWVTKDEGFFPSERKSVSVFLIASGYRDADSLSFKLEHNYEAKIKSLIERQGASPEIEEALDRGHIINVNDIVSATIWVRQIYNEVVSPPEPSTNQVTV